MSVIYKKRSPIVLSCAYMYMSTIERVRFGVGRSRQFVLHARTRLAEDVAGVSVCKVFFPREIACYRACSNFSTESSLDERGKSRNLHFIEAESSSDG